MYEMWLIPGWWGKKGRPLSFLDKVCQVIFHKMQKCVHGLRPIYDDGILYKLVRKKGCYRGE